VLRTRRRRPQALTGTDGRAPEADVLIVGYGPVGAVLAALLGERGIRVVVLERGIEPYDLPRAIALDDEVLRILSRLPGLGSLPDAVNAGQRAAFTDGELRVLAEIGFGETDLGFSGLAFFDQPSTERALRAGVDTLPTVSVRSGTTVTGLRHDPGGVTVEVEGGGTVRASWAVGCDGAGSAVRALLGVPFDGTTFAAPWLVVDVACDEPLTELPYFCYICDPQRPAVAMPRPGGHRFEWMIRPDEDPESMNRPAVVRALLARFTDPDRLTVIRSAVYLFHARTAARWRDGRVLLAGDAAHCMPQFAGQGLGAGVRDASALAWRLAEIVGGVSASTLLDSYEAERRPQVAAMTDVALLAGRLLQPTEPVTAAAVRYALRGLAGLPVLGSRLGALRPRSRRVLPNPRVRTRDGRLRRLDEVLPWRWAIIAAGRDPWIGLGPPVAERLRQREAVGLTVVPPGGLRSVAGLPGPVVEDLDGTVLRMLRPDRRLLVRPDRMLAPVSPPTAGVRGRVLHRLARLP
jgi:3-(3-hydroxy-phenyl)propionate hydroxylase